LDLGVLLKASFFVLFFSILSAQTSSSFALPAEEFYLEEYLIYGSGECSEFSDEDCRESDYDRCSEFGSDSGSEYCRGYGNDDDEYEEDGL